MRSASLTLLAGLLLSPALTPAEEPCAPVKPCEVTGMEAPGEAPAELAAEARSWFDLLSCRATPPGLDAKTVAAFCARPRPALAAYRDRTLAALRDALAPVRGQRVPTAVVQPLAGADLFGALAAYPDARSVTTLSSVPFGDVRAFGRLRDRARLRALLDAVAAASAPLLAGRSAATPPAVPAFALFLTALAAHGDEPVSLRYFRVEPQGGLHFLTTKELAAPARDAGPFDSAELTYVRQGEDPAADVRVHRHLAGDTSDATLARDPGLLAYLEARGKIAVLVRGTGAALAAEGKLLAALLGRATVVLGDRTAPTADAALAAGLTREAHPAKVPFGASPAGAADGIVVLRRP
jgi:hypothetical protein